MSGSCQVESCEWFTCFYIELITKLHWKIGSSYQPPLLFKWLTLCKFSSGMCELVSMWPQILQRKAPGWVELPLRHQDLSALLPLPLLCASTWRVHGLHVTNPWSCMDPPPQVPVNFQWLFYWYLHMRLKLNAMRIEQFKHLLMLVF